MALATRCKAPAAVCAAHSRRSVKVSAHKGAFEQVQVAAAAVAAAALLASPANAGVVLQQPELKKVFQDDAPAPAPVKREFKGLAPPSLPKPVEAPKPAAVAAAPEKKEEVKESGSDLDPRSIALPGALALTIGGFFAASKIDTSFNEWFIEAVVKDSNNYAGYEATLKTDAGVVFPKAATAGTKKVKAATGSKKGGFPFGGKK
ncbi:cytochrome b6-f complex subunit V [Volvox carteri f. nagariensis]|uniref:Cytochrome b6-f complex subunit petO, chloroplastic n=2 Tax=Volvox carteri TaxID=3067 RepID=PETO_VOLCA|nr:cytochrome b6-f complex subunit V [Volvox carteri f. nagariensis]Q9SBM5.1 RecName: Full=Cytochrome b6-f complex subunit petO, chloroplastic; AltName: Full=Cytochrome b6-f complex subunit V; Short=suV; AltName: Full=Cytochrome b6-f-associated phosphoprotein; Flags: Precursor [Volvox carteri]AAD55573.1 cytochrome b6f-associated phosphoprotein precursor [Volvox carteri f. nagariensis]EFJ52452.1 cytochrome b6-f complex subunit V [Volvox carteri f. nagariensis]|eukprot:XP_002946525.1 cytochrome b6-f complex subunit V [Volvox carteri f. nagariensis]